MERRRDDVEPLGGEEEDAEVGGVRRFQVLAGDVARGDLELLHTGTDVATVEGVRMHFRVYGYVPPPWIEEALKSFGRGRPEDQMI